MKGRHALLCLFALLLACGAAWIWVSDPGGGEHSRPGADAADDIGPARAHTTRDEMSRPRVGAQRDGADATAAGDELDLDAQDRIELMVLSAMDDEPIAGARALLLHLDNAFADTCWEGRDGLAVAWRPGEGEPLLEARSDVEGKIALHMAMRRANVVRIEADGYAPVVQSLASMDDIVSLWPVRERVLRVIDSHDDPIVAAVAGVHSWIGDPPVCTVVSDDAGRLSFSAGDGHELIVRAPGFATVWIEELDEWGDADVVMHAGGAVEGVVVTANGGPVVGAVVEVSEDTAFAALTGADGRFRFDGLRRSAEPYEISAESTEGLHGEAAARVGAADLRIVLEPLAVIVGRAFESDGSPASDVIVELPDRGVCTTPMDGWFTAGVPAGKVRIVARMLRDTGPLGGYPNTRGEVGFVELDLRAGEDVEGVEIHMEAVPASYLYFRVADPAGGRVRGYGLTYDDAHDRGFDERGGLHAEGEWRRLSEPVGTPVVLSFSTARDDDISDSFEATLLTRAQPDGEPDVVHAPHSDDGMVVLTLTTVRTDGQAIPEDADVNWLIANRNPHRVEGLPAGSPPTGVVLVPRGESASVMAWADGCGTLELTIPLTDEPQQSFECRLPPESLVSGHLVTRTGRPVTRAHVEVLVKRDDGTTSLSVASYDQLLPGGEFIADQLAGGHGRITVWDSDRRIVAERTFEVPEGGRVDLGDVVTGYLPHARGTITVGSAPASGVGIRARAQGAPYAETSTGPDGTFDLQVPLRPNATLEVTTSNGETRYSLEDVLASSPVILRGDPTGWISVAMAPRPAPGQVLRRVELRLPGGPRIRALLFQDDRNDPTYHGIPAGAIEIEAHGITPDGSEIVWRARTTVVAGERTDVTLTLDR